jgi:hypothetical protein
LRDRDEYDVDARRLIVVNGEENRAIMGRKE